MGLSVPIYNTRRSLSIDQINMRSKTDSADILQVSNLTVMRGDNVLIDGLTFRLEPGDTLWVAGSNGIGKTTLLKCIAGLLCPENGYITWCGQDIHKHPHTDTAYQGHHDGHKANLTVLENLQFWQSVFGSFITPQECLQKVGLSDCADLRAKGLSAGQSRRLALARLYMKKSSLWILDEPAAAMDVNGRTLIRNLLKQHVASGGCAIIASHTPPEKIGSNTRVLTLNEVPNE